MPMAPMPMDEERRLAYLDAMGIDVWIPRGIRGDLVSTDPSPEPVPALSPARLASVEPRCADAGMARAAITDACRGDWDRLEAAVAGCRACGLSETRTRTVFGTGCRTADLFVVGEAPGADEDRVGEPFVGRAGRLLNRMLAAIGLSREQVFIANVLKCRPPGNRDPRPDEADRCEDYLLRQIALVAPRLILCVGRIAAQHLLRTDLALGALRGRWVELRDSGIPLRVTYHPAYLLRSPEYKAKAWEDLVEVARRLDQEQAIEKEHHN